MPVRKGGCRVKKILIIADGLVARSFLKRLEELDTSDNIYHIVYYKQTTLPKKLSDHFIYYYFDPTSFVKLAPLIEDIDFFQVMLVLGNKIDLLATYENIRKVDKNLTIVMLDKWQLGIEEQHTIVMDMQERIAHLLSNYLPDIPLSAQNIGLGQGEIMEFKIPFGSSYVYRHIGNIEQKRWRIAALYRKGKLMLPDPKTMLLPDDTILVVGNPNVLQGVYRSVNRQFGQFPLPFGQNIYLLIDMGEMDDRQIDAICNDAILMHAKLNSKKLIFRVINARFGKALEKLKGYQESHSMEVYFDFLATPVEQLIHTDIETGYVGLVVADTTFFIHHTALLYRLKVPILKTGDYGLLKIGHSVVLSDESDKIEQLSSVIFDFSTLMELDITLFDFGEGLQEEHEKIIEHFENLAKLFEEKVRVVKTKKNPIRELLPRDDFLQFVIFEKKLLDPWWMALLSTDLERQYFRFRDKYQLFLPYES